MYLFIPLQEEKSYIQLDPKINIFDTFLTFTVKNNVFIFKASCSFDMLKHESTYLKEHNFLSLSGRLDRMLYNHFPTIPTLLLQFLCAHQRYYGMCSVFKSYSEGQKVFSCCVKSS